MGSLANGWGQRLAAVRWARLTRNPVVGMSLDREPLRCRPWYSARLPLLVVLPTLYFDTLLVTEVPLMRNSRAVLLAFASSVSAALLPKLFATAQDPGLVVRDASGRIRMTSFEKDGAFGLKLLDDNGGDCVVLRCGGRGEGVIDMYGANGKVTVSLGRTPGEPGGRLTLAAGDKGNSVSLLGRDDGDCMLSMLAAERGQLICGLDASGAALMTMTKGSGISEQSLSLRNGSNRNEADSAPGGMTISRAGIRVGGFLVGRNTGLAWFGDDALAAKEKWKGVRLGWGLEKGAFLEVRQNDSSHGVRVQDFAKEGAGVHVGKRGGEEVLVGIGASGPNVQLANERGPILRLPD
jgi:hypothetical protein